MTCSSACSLPVADFGTYKKERWGNTPNSNHLPAAQPFPIFKLANKQMCPSHCKIQRVSEQKPAPLLQLPACFAKNKQEVLCFVFFNQSSTKAGGIWFKAGVWSRFPKASSSGFVWGIAPWGGQVRSPEGDGISVACSEVILPSASGQLGVLANHAPMRLALFKF